MLSCIDSVGQSITCPSPYLYYQGTTHLMAYDPSAPSSTSNPVSTGIPVLPGAAGITFMPSINGGTLSPTFYVTKLSDYYYWDGQSWVNTGHSTGSTAANIGGCGGAIYNFSPPNSIYVYFGTSSSTLLTTIPAGPSYDIVTDCSCNFYILNAFDQTLVKYNPLGIIVNTYSLVGLPQTNGLAGFAIIGNDVYYQGLTAFYKGVIGTGSSISFSTTSIPILSVDDFASCPFTPSVTSGTLSVPSIICPGETTTISATTTVSPVSYSWSGPGIIGATNGSIITASVAGVYTCIINSSGCPFGPGSYTAAVNGSQCLTVTNTSITCASLGSATVVSTASGGPFSYTWMPTGQTGSVATGLNPGTYTINVFDFSNNITYTASTIFTSLIPLTGSLNAATSISCNGASTATALVTNFAGGSGSETYLWVNSVSSTTYNSPCPLLGAGIWSVIVTDALTGCQIKESFYISQPLPFNLVLSSSSPTACVGNSVTLSGQNSGGTPFLNGAGYTYSWTSGSASSVHVVSQALAGTSVYTLNSLDSLNCLATQTIGIDFIETVLTVSDVSICPLTVGTLTVSGATSYTWASTTFSLTGITFTDSPMTNTQYTVLGTALGCTATATASIILKQPPNPFVTSNSPRCDGDNLAFTAYGGVSYLWNGPSSFSSGLQNPNINPVSVNNAGVYNLTVTAVNGCTASLTQTMLVNPTPTLSAAGATICTSQTLNLSANSTATTFLWTGPQSFTSSLQNPFITNPVVGNTGTYTVKATSALGCTNNAIATVSVVLPPSLTAQLSSHSLCSQAFNGSPNTITLTAGGANTYSLVTVPDMFNSNPSGPVSPLSAIPPNTGIASATLSGSNGVCTVTTGLTFSIIPNPTVTISSPTPVICAGETYTYTNQGANTYTWSSATPGFTTYNNGGVAVAHPSINSVFSVFGGSLGCNSASQTSSITVNPLPQISLGPQTPTVCIGSKVNLSASGSSENYTWSPYTSLSSLTGNTVNAFPNSQQTYTVIGTLNSCTSTALITVSVVALPSPIATVVKPTICLNETITLQGFGGEIYGWQTPNTFYYEGQTVNFVANTPSYEGTYTLTVTDKNNCKASSTTSVTVYSLPGGSLLGTKMKGCVPFKSDFNYYSASPSSTAIATTWQVGSKLFSTKSFSTEFVNVGTYTITGNFIDTITYCVNTKTFVVEAYPVPVADFSFLPEKPIENLDQVIFTNNSTGEEQTKWNWYFTNNKGYISENKNTSYLFTEAGVYPIAMMVTNTWGCADTIVKAIKVEPDLSVYVPNVFTPNNDYLNDVFMPITRALKSYELLVFDRWGAKVFSTTKADEAWDGTYRGEPCKMDVYVWKISLSSVNGEMKTMTGNVMLSR